MTILLPVPYEHVHQPIFSREAQGAFLDNLALNGNVRLACRAARVSPQTAYRLRRRTPVFANLWDAALLSARSHAEEVLADRALNGVEEAVYYHGEEVARRVRYDARLLLAHLARLDRLAERPETRAALRDLDEAIEALARGEELPAEIAPLDPVPCVPACRKTQTEIHPEPEVETDEDYRDYCRRVRVMHKARPAGAPSLKELNEDPLYDLEMLQLEAFEEGLDEWWLITSDEELDERLDARDAALEAEQAEQAEGGKGAGH